MRSFAKALLLLLVAGVLYGSTIQYQQAIMVQESPLFSMPEVNAAQASTTPAKILADRNPANESAYQRLLFVNLDSTDTLCVFWLAAPGNCKMSGYTCDGAGSDSAIPIVAGNAWATTIAGDLTICAVGSASPTAFHVSRAEVP